MRIIVTLILALFLLGATDTDTANLTTTDPVAAGSWPDIEARCDSLGADCLCNETLDVASISLNGSFLQAGSSGTHAKECTIPGRTSGEFADSSATMDAVASTGEFEFPADNVGRYNADGFTSWLLDNRSIDGRTLCARWYVHFDSTSVTPSGGEQDLKMWNARDNGTLYSGPAIEAVVLSGGTLGGVFIPRPNNTSCQSTDPGSFPLVSGTDVNLIQAKDSGEWARYEWCVDHGEAGANLLTARSRVTALTCDSSICTEQAQGTYEHDYDTACTGTTLASNSGNAQWMNLDNQENNVGKPRYISGFIAIDKTADETFWPGPACEIEGCP